MMDMQKYGITLKGIGISVPPTIIRNEEISQLVDTSDEWIVSRTGFKERRVVAGDQLVTDLAAEAAQEALAYAGMFGEEIDMIIMASSTPDYIYPPGCAVVQQAIGAHRAFGFDLSMGCSGLVYSLGVANQFIQNGTVQNVLVVASDVHSRYTDWSDRNTCVLFGDGAGCFIVSRHDVAGETDLLGLDLVLEGSKGHEIRLPTLHENCPLVPPRQKTDPPYVYMNGREVFKFAVGEVPKYIEASLKKAGLTSQDVDHYVLHQANARIMSAMVERMDIPPEKLVVHLDKYSNTSQASIPLAFYEALKHEEIKTGDTVLLCGFGVGLSVATAILKWQAVDHRPQVAQQVETPQPVS